MRVIDVHVNGVDLGSVNLPECIRSQYTGPTSGFMVWGLQLHSRSHFVFLQGKVNSAHYIIQVVNAVLLPFLRRRCCAFSEG